MNDKTLKRIVTAGIIFLVVLITGLNCCSVVDPNERGVAVTLGTVQDGQLEPGMHFKAPFVTTIRKFRIEPKTFEVTFTTGHDGAITKDMQTVGTTVAIRWMYDTSRIMDIVKTYRDDSVIENAMRDNVKASVKAGHSPQGLPSASLCLQTIVIAMIFAIVVLPPPDLPIRSIPFGHLSSIACIFTNGLSIVSMLEDAPP